MLDTKDTNEVLVKGVRNGITKWEKVWEDCLRWKTKHIAGLEDVRVRGEQLAQAQQTIRDMRKAWRSDTTRDADVQAELRTKLDAALLHAKVGVSTLLFFSSCFASLILLASFYPYHLNLTQKADEKYRTKLEETTMENKRRRRQAEAKCEACQKEINEAMEKQKVIRQETRDKTRQDKTRQDKTRQDNTRQDDTGQDKTRQTTQDKTRHDKTRQDKTRQDSTRLDTHKQKTKKKGVVKKEKI